MGSTLEVVIDAGEKLQAEYKNLCERSSVCVRAGRRVCCLKCIRNHTVSMYGTLFIFHDQVHYTKSQI